MLGIPLDQPFSLAFGELHTLPRVIVTMAGTYNNRTAVGIGEASIDFPFVSYDMWDVYHALSSLQLVGRTYSRHSWRNQPPLIVTRDEESALLHFPAALTALSMANDDLWSRVHSIDLSSHTFRQSGYPMKSIGYKDPDDVISDCISHLRNGFVPKVKLGSSFEYDLELLVRISRHDEIRKVIAGLSADFNAAYSYSEAVNLFYSVQKQGGTLDPFITLEQPLHTQATDEELLSIVGFLEQTFEWSGNVIADEPIISVADAMRYARCGWLINYKMQRIGGYREALKIEAATNGICGMVGGTFPTAIGRSYDLWSVAALGCATLPSDAWDPSTDWFSGSKHLIHEPFIIDAENRTHVFQGLGFGISPNMDKIRAFEIADPKSEYSKIRKGGSGDIIRIILREGESYQDLYARLSGRNPFWNL